MSLFKIPTDINWKQKYEYLLKMNRSSFHIVFPIVSTIKQTNWWKIEIGLGDQSTNLVGWVQNLPWGPISKQKCHRRCDEKNCQFFSPSKLCSQQDCVRPILPVCPITDGIFHEHKWLNWWQKIKRIDSRNHHYSPTDKMPRKVKLHNKQH